MLVPALKPVHGRCGRLGIAESALHHLPLWQGGKAADDNADPLVDAVRHPTEAEARVGGDHCRGESRFGAYSQAEG